MAISEVHHVVNLEVESTFNILADFARHRVPLTRVRSVDGGFIARTAIGPIGFDDPMTITAWEPPHRLRIEKTGKVLAGWAEIEVVPAGPGSAIMWREEIRPAFLPVFVSQAAAVPTKLATEAMIRALLADLFADVA